MGEEHSQVRPNRHSFEVASGEARSDGFAAWPPEPPQGCIDFMTFVASLATNAMAALGVLTDTQAHGLPRDRELARQYIEIIAMLAYKTRGNLAADEVEGVGRLLCDLRHRYAQSIRGDGTTIP